MKPITLNKQIYFADNQPNVLLATGNSLIAGDHAHGEDDTDFAELNPTLVVFTPSAVMFRHAGTIRTESTQMEKYVWEAGASAFQNVELRIFVTPEPSLVF